MQGSGNAVELTFVVGTGRCGSTMLSRLLREHPDVLSMSEFFSTLRIAAACGPAGFPVYDMDGAQLWRLLASPFPMLDAMISDGLRTSEMLYPDHGRFGADTGIPLVSHYILPMLGADPDWLFDELAAEVPRWPRRPAAAQYQKLFGYLSKLLGRPVVVERSASSLRLIPLLHAQFPAARFVHLHRDGPDCALSMSRHPAFRREILAIGAVRSVKLPAGSTLQQVNDALPERLRGLVCPPYDARKLRDFPIPVEVFARCRPAPGLADRGRAGGAGPGWRAPWPRRPATAATAAGRWRAARARGPGRRRPVRDPTGPAGWRPPGRSAPAPAPGRHPPGSRSGGPSAPRPGCRSPTGPSRGPAARPATRPPPPPRGP